MLNNLIYNFKHWVAKDIIESQRKELLNKSDKLITNNSTIRQLQSKLSLAHDMLTNKNAACTQAQALFVTNHAIDRYKERIGYSGNDNDLRKFLYKEAIKHLATMDKLQDGKYDIAGNAIIRIKDNTICTVTPRTGLGKKALQKNKQQQSARDKYKSKKGY